VRLGARQAALWGHVTTALVELLQHLDATGHPLLPVAERVRAGHALGALGDGRFPVTLDEWRAASDYWCAVPAGPALIGTSANAEHVTPWEQPQHKVTLPTFCIARYPLTNAQWQQFVAAGGYNEARWWSAAGWAERDAASWAAPHDWSDLQFNGRNQPVVGISWYEAEAFCRWLSAELGQAIMVPSEAMWEKAARGPDGRRYPWGERRAIGLANTVEGGVGSTTPVGCYPDGASPCGALDTAGNVWEWTATPWSDGYTGADATQRGIAPDASAVIRGGVWARALEYARCSARDGFAPAGRGKIIGVRLALTNDDSKATPST
jgi:formylglycine-generating enzyme required for sulfatase activity